MDKSNELFTKLKKRIGGAKLEKILQELNDDNNTKETETAVSFIEEISPPSSSKEHGNSNSSSNNNNELYLNEYYHLFMNQEESVLAAPPPPPPPSPSPPVGYYYHHEPLPPLQPPRKPSILNSPRTTATITPAISTPIASAVAPAVASSSPRASSPIDLTYIAPTLSPLPPSPPLSTLPSAPATYKTPTITTTASSSSPRKNTHPKKLSPPKPKKFGIGKNMNLYKRLCEDSSSSDNDDESDEATSSSLQPVKKYRIKLEYYKKNNSSGLYEIFKTKPVPYYCKNNQNIIVYNKKQFEELNLIFDERKNYLDYLEQKHDELVEKIKRKNRKKNIKRKSL